MRHDEVERVKQILGGRGLPGAFPLVRLPQPSKRSRSRSRSSRTIGLTGLAATATVGALVLVAPGGGGNHSSLLNPVGTAQAVTFRAVGAYTIALVRNPYVGARRMRALFTQHHLDITLRLLPASPSEVGSVISETTSGPRDAIQPLVRGSCLNGPCTIGLRIAKHFSGQATLTIGRPAHGDETYATAAISAFAPGETLHCSDLLGARAPYARASLRSMGYKIHWRNLVAHGGTETTRTVAPAPSWYVWGAVPAAPHKVIVWLRRRPFTVTRTPGGPNYVVLVRRLEAGC